jgi:cysteine-rich repeat protein
VWAQTTTTTGPTTSTSLTPSTTSTTLAPMVHQLCFKVSDSLRLRSPDPAWLELANAQLGAQNCRVVGGSRFVCVPVTARVTGTLEGSVGSAPYTPIGLGALPTEQAITQDRLCYKVKCLDRPNLADETVLYSDQLETRQVGRFKAGLICGPAIQALCGNGTLDFGEECDDGNNVDRDCCTGLCKAEAAGKITGCIDNDANVCTEAACDGLGHCLQTGILPTNTKACTDSDNNPCTVARCDGAGACDQLGVLQPTSTTCTDSDGNDCTQARCDGAGACDQNGIVRADGSTCTDSDGNSCTRAQCSSGVCDQTVLLAPGTICTETDGNLCTTPGCDGAGTCDQNFFVRNCTLPAVCNPSTGQCQ